MKGIKFHAIMCFSAVHKLYVQGLNGYVIFVLSKPIYIYIYNSIKYVLYTLSYILDINCFFFFSESY